MSRRSAAVAVGVVALATLAILGFYAMRSEIPAATPSPTPASSPTVAAASATPTPSASASATAGSSRYGWVVVGGGGLALTDETGTTIQQHPCGFPGRGCSQQMIAVSPDGRRVAFWRTAQGQRWELATFEAATPATARGVATLPEGMEGQSLAWATDSRGLLFAAQTVGYGGIRGGAGRATLTGIDVTTPAPATDVMPTLTDGRFYVPVAWDRTMNVVAAVTSGEGGFVGEYMVKVGDKLTTTRANAGQFAAWQVQASPDATRVLAIDMQANVLRMWPVTDFSAQVEAKPAQGGGRINGALWRNTNEVAWAFGDRFDVFASRTDGASDSRTVYTAPGVRLVAMRPDGSGALVASGGQPNVSTGLFIVDIQSGNAASRTAMDVNQAVVPRGIVR